MHCFLYVRLHGFYTANHTSEGIVIVHREKHVICANERAVKQGIQVGMPLAEAKAIVREASFIPWTEKEFQLAQEQWLDICSCYSNVIEPEDQHAAYLDISTHPDPTDIAIRLTNSLPYVAEIGLAGTKWIAKLAAARLTGRTLYDDLRLREPLLDPAGFLAPLSVKHLLPVAARDRQRLHFLGYRTIGEVTNLSLSTLRKQFGDAALKIYQAAWGGCFESVRALYPRDAMGEGISFEGSVQTSEVLDHGLTQIAERLSERLRKLDLSGADMVVWIEREGGARERRERSFVKSLQSSRAILTGLRLMLPPPIEHVVGIRVALSNLCKSKRKQLDLYGSIAEKTTSKAQAISQLRNAFGHQALLSGSDIQEPRRKRVLRAWKDATGWR
jgi:DNA polymerase-4